MRRFFVRFNRSESFVHTQPSAGFTIITSGFEFSVHTRGRRRMRTIPFAALPNIQDIVGAAIADIAISIRGRFAGANHESEINGTPRSVIHRPWDRVDAGVGTGHKTPCFGYACAAMVGCFVGSTFASWSEA